MHEGHEGCSGQSPGGASEPAPSTHNRLRQLSQRADHSPRRPRRILAGHSEQPELGLIARRPLGGLPARGRQRRRGPPRLGPVGRLPRRPAVRPRRPPRPRAERLRPPAPLRGAGARPDRPRPLELDASLPTKCTKDTKDVQARAPVVRVSQPPRPTTVSSSYVTRSRRRRINPSCPSCPPCFPSNHGKEQEQQGVAQGISGDF